MTGGNHRELGASPHPGRNMKPGKEEVLTNRLPHQGFLSAAVPKAKQPTQDFLSTLPSEPGAEQGQDAWLAKNVLQINCGCHRVGSPAVPCSGKKRSSHRMLALLSPTVEARPLLVSHETMWPDRRQANQKCPQVSPMGHNLPEGVSLERAGASRQDMQ